MMGQTLSLVTMETLNLVTVVTQSQVAAVTSFWQILRWIVMRLTLCWLQQQATVTHQLIPTFNVTKLVKTVKKIQIVKIRIVVRAIKTLTIAVIATKTPIAVTVTVLIATVVTRSVVIVTIVTVIVVIVTRIITIVIVVTVEIPNSYLQ